MKDPASIFNDVIGPIMIGPSSSHTAASVRIGRLIRQIANNRPRKICFEFAKGTSLANTYQSQGTDFGLAGGILGYDTADADIVNALSRAIEAKIDIEFQNTDFRADHPNVLRAVIIDGLNRRIETEFVSRGGGMITLRRIEGIPVSIKGGFYETLFLFDSKSQTIAHACRDFISTGNVNSEALVLCHKSTHHKTSKDQKSAIGYIVHCQGQDKMSDDLSAQMNSAFPIKRIINLEPVLPVKSYHKYNNLFNTATEILELIKYRNLSLADIAIIYETRRGKLNEETVLAKMEEIVTLLEQTIKASSASQDEYTDRILGRQAQFLSRRMAISGKVMHHIIRHITLLMEAKSSMKPIVAAPTAGSCAVVPGTLIGAAMVLGFSKTSVVEAMLAAGMLGILIAEHSTFSGEVGGCQAECGSASGMAAAGLVHLLGGNVRQALDAASMALQNVFGLTCDPVAGRVEVPCLGKNIMAGVNALSMAELALAGFDKVIPLDETIEAMYKVGLLLPPELKCTGMGGLALTPTAKKIHNRLTEAKP